MEFITANIMWFIGGGIILLMTIIGYYAEKTDFGRRNIDKPVKEKNKKKNLSDEKTVIENITDTEKDNIDINLIKSENEIDNIDTNLIESKNEIES
ncbi:MAG: hypothetical protein RR623_05795, partial [Bacilli bacterium]